MGHYCPPSRATSYYNEDDSVGGILNGGYLVFKLSRPVFMCGIGPFKPETFALDHDVR